MDGGNLPWKWKWGPHSSAWGCPKSRISKTIKDILWFYLDFKLNIKHFLAHCCIFKTVRWRLPYWSTRIQNDATVYTQTYINTTVFSQSRETTSWQAQKQRFINREIIWLAFEAFRWKRRQTHAYTWILNSLCTNIPVYRHTGKAVASALTCHHGVAGRHSLPAVPAAYHSAPDSYMHGQARRLRSEGKDRLGLCRNSPQRNTSHPGFQAIMPIRRVQRHASNWSHHNSVCIYQWVFMPV